MSLLSLDGHNFKESISQGVSLVDFWATWCGPCRMINPIIEKIAKDFSGQLTVGKVNIDENSGLAEEFNVSSIPTILIFKDGKEVDRLVGANSENVIVSTFEKYL